MEMARLEVEKQVGALLKTPGIPAETASGGAQRMAGFIISFKNNNKKAHDTLIERTFSLKNTFYQKQEKG